MKKKYFQILALAFALTLTSSSLFGQIFQTRSDIIKEEGFNYESGNTDNGTKYIIYKKDYTSEQSGKYTRYKIIYFTTLDTGKEFCSFWKTLEPASETNSNVAFFKKNMVQIEYMTWKDYETDIIYKIAVEDGICTITASHDFEKQ